MWVNLWAKIGLTTPAQTFQANPTILRALLDSHDMQDIAEGVISRAQLLAYFRQMHADKHPLTLPNPTN